MIRRAQSTETTPSRWNHQQQQHSGERQLSDIFRPNSGEKQSRNEMSDRLQQNTEHRQHHYGGLSNGQLGFNAVGGGHSNNNNNNSGGVSINGGMEDSNNNNHPPQDRMDRAIFRARADSIHLPIGTPMENGFSGSLGLDDFGTANSNSGSSNLDSIFNTTITSSRDNFPSIRLSLSCPTSVYESPLFGWNNSNDNINNNGQNMGINSIAAIGRVSSGGGLEGGLVEVDSADTSNDDDDDNASSSSNHNSNNKNNDLEAVDVSVIEYDEEASFQMNEEDPTSNENEGNNSGGAVVMPMRNLNDAFDLLVVDGVQTAKKGKAATTAEDTTKPSPTSVLDLYKPPSTPITTVQLENGVKVASIQMPHFTTIHPSLKGELSQGLIDRVSFYSIVRDINKEAMDAVSCDPRGSAYNKSSSRSGNSNAPSGGDVGAAIQQCGSSGGNTVVAEDGKVHFHPNVEEESKSVLVMACQDAKSVKNASQSSSSLGATLLDEEWWLMSAIASRSPDEVSCNHATKLLPTFSEAMGEKDADTHNGGSSRTQLWKPGRSWWEAKSGKNPWVEPIVHNNRWR